MAAANSAQPSLFPEGDQFKRCKRCRELLPVESFCVDRSAGDGRKGACRSCVRDYKKKTRARLRHCPKAKAVARNARLRWSFGISLAEYERMRSAQGGLCAICRKPSLGRNQYGPKPLAVDHDHKTGKVRALLCSRCNVLLGMAGDDIEILERAISYVKRFSRQS